MAIGLVGKKCGMTRVFDSEGRSTSTTVLEVEPNIIAQVKTLEVDGYRAIQVTTGKKKLSRVNKPMAGHYAKAKIEAGRGLWEFRLDDGETANVELKSGSAITVALFTAGQFVDVQGETKGKGFAGVVKRHHFSTQDATHGNSLSHRAPGSIGQRQSPGKVFKGKRMAGHMGCDTRTAQNLEIIKVDQDRNLLLIKGAVPGATGSDIIILPASKKSSSKGDK